MPAPAGFTPGGVPSRPGGTLAGASTSNCGGRLPVTTGASSADRDTPDFLGRGVHRRATGAARVTPEKVHSAWPPSGPAPPESPESPESAPSRCAAETASTSSTFRMEEVPLTPSSLALPRSSSTLIPRSSVSLRSGVWGVWLPGCSPVSLMTRYYRAGVTACRPGGAAGSTGGAAPSVLTHGRCRGRGPARVAERCREVTVAPWATFDR